MAQKLYKGKTVKLPGNSREEKSYNAAAQNVEAKYLGDFSYPFNFPHDAKLEDIGTKYDAAGFTCSFSLWQVTNKGRYTKKNRPGEREMPLVGGGKALVSYVVTPQICVDKDQSDLVNYCEYKEGHEYTDVVDPVAVALSVNGSGLAKIVASTLVDEATSGIKKTMKVYNANEEDPAFIGFANSNHCAVMTSVVLRENEETRDIYEAYPGEIPLAPFDPTLNPTFFSNFDMSKISFPQPPVEPVEFNQ